MLMSRYSNNVDNTVFYTGNTHAVSGMETALQDISNL